MARIVGNLSDWHIFSENRNLIANDALDLRSGRTHLCASFPWAPAWPFFNAAESKAFIVLGMFPCSHS